MFKKLRAADMNLGMLIFFATERSFHTSSTFK